MSVLFEDPWTAKLMWGADLRAPVRRILVVDDDRDVLVSLTNVLRTEFPFVDVRVAASLEAAVQLAKAEPFDVVLAHERFHNGFEGRLIPLRKPVDTEALLETLRREA